ncbi:MAG: hypothetical protein KatS3mg008_1973 [Acidimicrobiales bacterium]|nr:MAG: hypothetical protein KatS3mg008_1973 [Acidimicrobiales bacterium]
MDQVKQPGRPEDGTLRGEGVTIVLDQDDSSPDYRRKVGERLRAIRRQKGLSLQDVEQASNEEFKASVLGAYERGERSISVLRLQRLARFYDVPVDQLLPETDRKSDVGSGPVAREQPLVIDLGRLGRLEGEEVRMLRRYLRMIQVRRQDFNGRVLTVRRDDHDAIAAILGTSVEGLREKLRELGVLVQAPGSVRPPV